MTARIIAAIAAVAWSTSATAGEILYVHQGIARAAPNSISADMTAALQSRDAWPFGERGVEQGARIRAGVGQHVALAVAGTVLVSDERSPRSAFEAEVAWTPLVLREWRGGVAGGYRLDYEGVSVPRLRVEAERLGRLAVVVSGAFDFPLASVRDAADVRFATGASYAVARAVRIGAECAGEELEGLWDSTEAEGGARVAVGPTVWFGSTDLRVVVHAGVAASVGSQRQLVDGPRPRTGGLGRLVVEWRL